MMEGALPYMCFIESEILSVPHMEFLIAEDPTAAVTEATALLARHASGYAAHIFEGDERIASIRKPPVERDAGSRPSAPATRDPAAECAPQIARLARGLRDRAEQYSAEP